MRVIYFTIFACTKICVVQIDDKIKKYFAWTYKEILIKLIFE